MSFVYVISGERQQKIGWAVDPAVRLKALQTGSSYPLELVFSLATPFATRVERRAHEILKEHRGLGEWFTVSRETATETVMLAGREIEAEVQHAAPVNKIIRTTTTADPDLLKLLGLVQAEAAKHYDDTGEKLLSDDLDLAVMRMLEAFGIPLYDSRPAYDTRAPMPEPWSALRRRKR